MRLPHGEHVQQHHQISGVGGLHMPSPATADDPSCDSPCRQRLGLLLLKFVLQIVRRRRRGSRD